jgi:hypothetical protein
MMRRFALSLALLPALLLGAAGCGGGKPPTLPVTGKVVFNQTEPAAGALVVFHPSDPELEKRIGGKPFARVGEDGTFTLTTYAQDDGAPAGDYGVTVDYRAPAREVKLSISDGGGSGALKVKEKYANPQSPVLRATVKQGEPNTFTFDVD